MNYLAKILLVEENNFHRSILKKSLLECFDQSEITVARTLMEALDLVHQHKYDLVIVDFKNIEHDELRFLKIIKRQVPTPSIIVIASECRPSAIKAVRKFKVDELYFMDSSLFEAVPQLAVKVLARRIAKDDPSDNSATDLNVAAKIATRTLAHEINNPLMTIVGLAELILDNCDNDDDATTEKIKTIQKSALRICSSLEKLVRLNRPAIKNSLSGRIIDLEKSDVLA